MVRRVLDYYLRNMGKPKHEYVFVALVLLFPLCMGAGEEAFYSVRLDTFEFKGGDQVSGSGDAEPTLVRGGGVRLPVEHSLSTGTNASVWLESLSQILKTEIQRTVDVNAAQIPIGSGNQNQGGGYTVTLGLGTPPQQVVMTLDTANSPSWVDCSKQFNPRNSKSFRQTKCGGGGAKCPPLGDPSNVTTGCNGQGLCTFELPFADGSKVSGEYMTEVLSAGGVFNNFQMGCGHKVLGGEGYTTGGSLALGRSPLSMPAQTHGGVFSYCLPNFLSERAKGSLWLGQGSIPANVNTFTPMQTIPELSPELYLVELEAMSVGTERFNVPQQISGLKTVTIIQAANLVTRLSAQAYQALRASFLKQTSHLKQATPYGNLDTCFQLSRVESARIPAVTFHFKGNANVVVKDIGTVLLVKEGVACLAFVPTAADNPVNTIGSAQQQGIRLAFDNVRNQIGFAPDSC